jgi:hypothetical protein
MVHGPWNEVHQVSAQDRADVEEGRRGEEICPSCPSCPTELSSRNPVSFFKSTPLSSLTVLKFTSGRRRRSTVSSQRGSGSILAPDQYSPSPAWPLTPDPDPTFSLRSFRGGGGGGGRWTAPLACRSSQASHPPSSLHSACCFRHDSLSGSFLTGHAIPHSSWLFSVPNSKFSVLWKSSWVGRMPLM